MGRYLNVKRAMLPKGLTSAGTQRARPASCRTVFVKNLPYSCTEQDVNALFSAYGGVASVRLSRWNHTGRLKGFGYVQFEQAKAAEKVMRAANGGRLNLEGRALHLDYDTGAPKRSFRTADGRMWAKEEHHAAQALKRDSVRRSRHSQAS